MYNKEKERIKQENIKKEEIIKQENIRKEEIIRQENIRKKEIIRQEIIRKEELKKEEKRIKVDQVMINRWFSQCKRRCRRELEPWFPIKFDVTNEIFIEELRKRSKEFPPNYFDNIIYWDD